MGLFQDTVERFAPSWFQERWMRTLLQSVAAAYDEMDQRVFAGQRAAIPYAGGAKAADGTPLECDEVALAAHANDRGIRLYDSEPLLSRRVRVSRWHQLKKRRGTHRGELENLQPFWRATVTSTLPTIRIVFQNNQGTPKSQWHTMSPTGKLSVIQRSPSNFDYDGQAIKRTRFFLIVHLPPGYGTGIAYDDGYLFDGGGVYDGVGALALRDMADAIREAKGAYSRLSAVIVTTLQPTDVIPGVAGTHYAFDPTDTAQAAAEGWTTLPTGNWGSTVDPGTGLGTRPPWASWIYEDNP